MIIVFLNPLTDNRSTKFSWSAIYTDDFVSIKSKISIVRLYRSPKSISASIAKIDPQKVYKHFQVRNHNSIWDRKQDRRYWIPQRRQSLRRPKFEIGKHSRTVSVCSHFEIGKFRTQIRIQNLVDRFWNRNLFATFFWRPHT